MAGVPSLRAAAEQAANEYRRPKLKITEIRTAEVRVTDTRSTFAFTPIKASSDKANPPTLPPGMFR